MLGKFATGLAALTATAAITVLGGTLVLSRTVGLQAPLPNWALCMTGLGGEDCIDPEKIALEEERRQLLQSKADLQEERRRLEAEIDALRGDLKNITTMEARFEHFSVFHEERLSRPGYTVTTGVRYDSLSEEDDWIEAWCYLSIPADGDLKPRLTLGNADFGSAPKLADVDDKSLRDAGLTRPHIEEARGKCAWPDSSS